MIDDSQRPVLIDVEVLGLFGRFDHRVAFPESWDFVILHGVNGVGKTKVLDLVKSALGGNLRRLAQIPFAEASLTFSNGSRVELTRSSVPTATRQGAGPASRPALTVTLRPKRSKPVTLDPTIDWLQVDARAREELERFTPLLVVDEDAFFDTNSGETLSTAEALERYGHALPGRRRVVEEGPQIPEPLRTFWQESNVHLIETQRLLRAEPPGRRARMERGPERVSTVMRFSEEAAGRIQQALSELGRRSQELDRTFPSRLVAPLSSNRVAPNEADVRRRYDEQLKLRRRLTRISVLDAFGADLQLPKESLDPVVLRVMTEFLSDSEEKFKVVEPLLDRLELLTNVLNAKFQYKRLEVDRHQGFIIRTQDETVVRPDQLSSGEQHELVLLYDLLFGARDNALVLIDEPEISLHVNWQKRFLPDLREVSALAHHRFIVATHSPTIVGKFSDRMVRLEGK